MKVAIKYGVLILIPIICCLGLLEGYLRYIGYAPTFDRNLKAHGWTSNYHYTYDPVTGYSLIPNMVDAKHCITTDANGNRIPARPYDKNKPTIIFVGDSSVFGAGVCDNENYVYLLGADPELGKKYNFVNMGVASYSLGHIDQVLRQKVQKYHPAAVFVAILWPWKAFNDYGGGDNWKKVNYDFYKKIFPVRDHFVEDPFSSKTPRLYFFFSDMIKQMEYGETLRENFSRPGVRDFDLPPAQEIKYADDHIDILEQDRALLQKQGVPVVFFMHPYQYTIYNEKYKKLGVLGYDRIVDKLGALDFKCFMQHRKPESDLYLDGSHLTFAGHQNFRDIFKKLILNDADDVCHKKLTVLN